MLKIQKEELPEMGVMTLITGPQLLARMKVSMLVMLSFQLRGGLKFTYPTIPTAKFGLLLGVTLSIYLRITLYLLETLFKYCFSKL
jgi:hypothetical protein